jgi:integrase
MQHGRQSKSQTQLLRAACVITTRTSPHTATAGTRHTFTSAVLDAAGGNTLIARDAGGWASAAMVDEIYGHVDVHDPAFDAPLRAVWGEA